MSNYAYLTFLQRLSIKVYNSVLNNKGKVEVITDYNELGEHIYNTKGETVSIYYTGDKFIVISGKPDEFKAINCESPKELFNLFLKKELFTIHPNENINKKIFELFIELNDIFSYGLYNIKLEIDETITISGNLIQMDRYYSIIAKRKKPYFVIKKYRPIDRIISERIAEDIKEALTMIYSDLL